MRIDKKEILNKWLQIEFNNVAHKANLIFKNNDIDDDLIYDTVRWLDYETIVEEQPSVNYIITVIGILWEHIDHEKYDLRPLIIKILSRIGYPTSAIICDKKFDFMKCSFTNLGSWIDKITNTMYQFKNEVVVCGKNFLLTDFQKQIWDNMDGNKVIGISAPTSAGKSFVILLKLLERLSTENLDIVYIVPTLSLVNQVTEDFNREIKKMNILDCLISNSFDKVPFNGKHIYVMTQEKVVVALSDFTDSFSKKFVLVVDEIQNIERMENCDDDRARVLYDVLIEFRYNKNVEQIILSGPRIEKIDKVGKDIFDINAKELTTMISPVVNLTYSIQKYANKYYFKQYCLLNEQPIVEEIENKDFIKGYGQKNYTESYLQYLNNFIQNVGGTGQNIIFSPTSNTARKIAMSLQGNTTVIEAELIKYYQDTIHKDYALCDVLKRGVAFHHGKLPMHVRRTLERAIADKKIRDIVCTTTLLQGVNLPAQNMFIRNPHLYISKGTYSAELTNYEMANLRGRTGRLLKDFVGRTYVMDENEFKETEGYEQVDLFEDVTMELPSNYENKYNEFKEDIGEILDTDKLVDENMQAFGYLVTYIRQSILKHGSEAVDRMKNVGINLTKDQVAAIMLKLDKLNVSKEVCHRNRYWDPLALDVINNSFTSNIPLTPFDSGIRNKIKNMLLFLRNNNSTCNMYNKYIPQQYRSGGSFEVMVSLCIDWMQGKSLNKILSNSYYNSIDGADRIDKTIDLLENTISFKIPLLLKPIFDINETNSKVLYSMQTGTPNEISGMMIDMGVARETALYLEETIDFEIISRPKDKFELEEIIRKGLRKNIDILPYWVRVQVEYLV